VIPSADAGEAASRRLRARATEVIELRPPASEDADSAARRRVVCLSDVLLAVWDGVASRGMGSTADVVAFAGERGRSDDHPVAAGLTAG